MDYLLLAYGATVIILGLAAWRVRAGLGQAESDLAAGEPRESGAPDAPDAPYPPERVADGT